MRAGRARCWPRQASLMLRLDSSFLPDPPAAVCSGGLTSPPVLLPQGRPPKDSGSERSAESGFGPSQAQRTPTLPDSVSLRNACFAHLPCTEAGKHAETHSAHRPGRHLAEAPPRMIAVFWRGGRGGVVVLVFLLWLSTLNSSIYHLIILKCAAGWRCVHVVVQPSPPSTSRNCSSSQTETVPIKPSLPTPSPAPGNHLLWLWIGTLGVLCKWVMQPGISPFVSGVFHSP